MKQSQNRYEDEHDLDSDVLPKCCFGTVKRPFEVVWEIQKKPNKKAPYQEKLLRPAHLPPEGAEPKFAQDAVEVQSSGTVCFLFAWYTGSFFHFGGNDRAVARDTYCVIKCIVDVTARRSRGEGPRTVKAQCLVGVTQGGITS